MEKHFLKFTPVLAEVTRLLYAILEDIPRITFLHLPLEILVHPLLSGGQSLREDPILADFALNPPSARIGVTAREIKSVVAFEPLALFAMRRIPESLKVLSIKMRLPHRW